MKYILSEKYNTKELQSKIMGPNPIKLAEELLSDCKINKEYGFKVYAADLWSEPEENRKFFEKMGLSEENIVSVKADALNMPFEKEFFDGIISVDSYNYFGRDKKFLDEKLLPYIKKGGYLYIAIPGMKKDLHKNLPKELLLSWTPEQMEYMHDCDYWRDIVGESSAEVICVEEMESNEEVWNDWLRQENEYAVGDRKSMQAGAGKYLNFIKIVLKK